MAQSFTYDDLPDDSIRLVEIITADVESEHVVLRLSTYHLDNAPVFNTLSYVWGQSPEKHQVLCQGGAEEESHVRVLTLTSNLFHALPFIKSASDLPIWIDAICIDQDNDGEKAKVVPRMGTYYGKAVEVLVWLGPSANDSDLAMDVLSWLWISSQREALQQRLCMGSSSSVEPSQLAALSSALESEVYITDVVEDSLRLGVPDHTHVFWKALLAVYQREWFYRVWTFQEIMLATRASVLCGDRTIPWPAFKQLGDKMCQTQLMWIGRQSSQDDFLPLRNLKYPYENDGQWFWAHLQGARDRSCKFKEDRIFGMLAIAPWRISAKIKVEYRYEDPDHYVKVYRHAAIAFLEEAPIEVVFIAATRSGRAEKVPSWCPDWSMSETSIASQARFKRDLLHIELGRWMVDPVKQNVLRVLGQQLDIVNEVISVDSDGQPRDGVSGIDGHAGKTLQWLDRCEAVTRRTITSDEIAATEAFLKTLFLHSGQNAHDFPLDAIRALAVHRKRLTADRDSIPQSPNDLSVEDLRDLQPLLTCITMLWPGRVFFSTQGGTVGMADNGIANGDLICMFFGARSHFVLRHFDDGTDENELKAVAYVHGMMGDVETALKLRDGDVPLQERAQAFRIR